MAGLGPAVTLPADDATVPLEPMARLCVYFAINGKKYGSSSHYSLTAADATSAPSFTATFYQRENCLKGHITIYIKIARALDVKTNPAMEGFYWTEIRVNAEQIREYVVREPGIFTLPDHFNASPDWGADEKGLITF